MKEGEGLSQKTYIRNTQTHKSVLTARGKGGEGQVEVGKVGQWGQKETWLGAMGARCSADDALLSCTLEPCLVLQTNVTPINSIKNNFRNN